jgi:DNA-binding SARP family transcriptional activator
MAALRIRLLGGFRVEADGRPIDDRAWRLRKSANVVKLLALAPGHRLHKDQLLDRLWPDLGLAAADRQLRKTLHDARRVLDPDPAAVLTSAPTL